MASKSKSKAEAAAEGGKMEEALLKRMMQSESIDSKSQAIAISKDRGWIKQAGSNLALTEQGRSHAREAQRHLKKDAVEEEFKRG